MLYFIANRLWQGTWVLFGIVSVLFVIFFALGDPTEYMVAERADAATKAAIRKKYALDQPLPAQYWHYLQRLAHGDLGRSFQSDRPVWESLRTHAEGTAILATAAMLIAMLLGVSLGVAAALLRHTWIDSAIVGISMLGISAPSFFVAIVLAWLFAVLLHPFTGLRITGYIFEPAIFSYGNAVVWRNLLLPAVALGIRPLAVFVQLTRTSLVSVLSEDYIRTARAKGASATRVIIRHALRNALNPVITSITGWFASLLAGAFFVESIFQWRGLGKLTIDALNEHDFPVIIGCALLVGIIFIVMNIITDLLYRFLDPRIA
jgi:peptide/nickel transport system permease protein